MSRIPRSDVYKALEVAAQNVRSAGGADGVTSRADMAKKLKELSGSERALTDMFFRFIDKRDAAPGVRVTEADLKKALAYAKSKLVDAYDLNRNGLSASEIARMSTTGKLAVAVAKQTGSQVPGEALDAAALKKAIAKASGPGLDFEYISEGDYPVKFDVVGVAGTHALTAKGIADLFKPVLGDDVLDSMGTSNPTQEELSKADTRSMIAGLKEADPLDPESVKAAKKWAAVLSLIEKNLTSVRLVKIGPPDDDGRLSIDQGTYAYVLAGKTRDGKIAGLHFGSVET